MVKGLGPSSTTGVLRVSLVGLEVACSSDFQTQRFLEGSRAPLTSSPQPGNHAADPPEDNDLEDRTVWDFRTVSRLFPKSCSLFIADLKTCVYFV